MKYVHCKWRRFVHVTGRLLLFPGSTDYKAGILDAINLTVCYDWTLYIATYLNE